MILNKYNSKIEKLSDILKRKEFDYMVRSVCALFVTIKNNVDTKYIPKKMSIGTIYPVVAEKSVKYTKENKEHEELSFGIINDEFELIYCASYNLKISTNHETLVNYINQPEVF